MHSKYLNIDLPLTEQTMTSSGEEVRIIPHDVLEDVILNSETTQDYNINVHYTPIATNEPRHYVFLCAISDKFGRRAESIGESLDETLETPIAKNYPALMAFKRAFDAAAINYLGLDGKVYTDQQINAEKDNNNVAQATSVTLTTPDEDDDDLPTLPSTADALAAIDDDDDDMPPVIAPSTKQAKKATTASAFAALPDDDDDDIAMPIANADIYDMTKVNVGSLKGKNISIREAFHTAPDTIDWIINQMQCFTRQEEELRNLVIRYKKEVAGV